MTVAITIAVALLWVWCGCWLLAQTWWDKFPTWKQTADMWFVVTCWPLLWAAGLFNVLRDIAKKRSR